MRNRSTATRLVSQLEKRHLVERTGHPDDGRTHNVNLTPGGLAHRQKAHEAYLQSFERRFSVLSEEDRKTLSQLLSILRDGLLGDLDSHYQGGDRKPDWK